MGMIPERNLSLNKMILFSEEANTLILLVPLHQILEKPLNKDSEMEIIGKMELPNCLAVH